ncbi:MAG: putative spermidine/putrescine transport system ATP-binding protein [Thermoleophilaceae bacterium]|nr:putative spermidine/putrescine transport system ATP-binding protein [Thermoleophilaceae bacterium]
MSEDGNTAKPPALVVRGLRKDYGDETVVSDFDFEVADGEFVTLLGSSGSGKTTTLMMVAGLVEPTGGTMEIAGRPVTGVPPQRRNIGMMFQSYALFPHLTVFDNVAFPLKRRRLPKAQISTLVNEALQRMQLEGFGHRYPAQLSGGQQQRVALARATAYEPPLLLMDEPLSALDRNLRRSLQDELKRFHRTLRTAILYVTHDQEEALSLSDRVILMTEGRVAQVGTPQEIYQSPRSLFVARFLGESNALHGEVVSCAGGEAVVKLRNGQAVGGTCREPLPTGSQAVVIIRPENLVVETNGAGGDGDGVDISLEEVSFLGETVRWRGTFATSEPCTLMIKPDQASDVSVGATRRVRWEPSKAVVLPAEA